MAIWGNIWIYFFFSFSIFFFIFLGVACCFCYFQVPMGCCTSSTESAAPTSTIVDHRNGSRAKGCPMEELGYFIQISATSEPSCFYCCITSYNILCYPSHCSSRNSKIWKVKEMVSSCHGLTVDVRINFSRSYCKFLGIVYILESVLFLAPKL